MVASTPILDAFVGPGNFRPAPAEVGCRKPALALALRASTSVSAMLVVGEDTANSSLAAVLVPTRCLDTGGSGQLSQAHRRCTFTL